jgi:hypothetical protein
MVYSQHFVLVIKSWMIVFPVVKKPPPNDTVISQSFMLVFLLRIEDLVVHAFVQVDT